MGRSRQIFLEVGTQVGVRFFDHTKKNRGVNAISGRITQLNDSSITIKKSMAKREVTINVRDIRKLLKQKAGKYVIAVALPVMLSIVSVAAYPIAPPLIALSVFPSVGLANVIFRKHAVKHPLKFKIVRS
jgi:hypothetical protein